MRSQHRKNANKQKAKIEQAALHVPKWRFEEQMSFLKEFMKDRSRISSAAGDESNEAEDGTEYFGENEGENYESYEFAESGSDIKPEPDAETPTALLVPQKLKKPVYLDKVSKESAPGPVTKHLADKEKEDPLALDKFFSLMASTAKKFNLADQHHIKTQVFSLVSEIERKYIMLDENRLSNPSTSQFTSTFSVLPAVAAASPPPD